MNGDRSLSFLLPKSETNALTFDMVEEESLIEYAGHSYRIKNVTERVVKQTPVKIVTAPHVFFDLVDDYRYDTLTTGFKSIAQVLSFIFNGTDWTFSVIDSFDTVEFENFGDANCLELFSKVLERYGAEYDLNGNDVIIREQIGSLIDLQFRYNHNIKTLDKSVDTSNLSTYIRGTGKRNENGTYVVEAEYTSPNAAIFGIKHAPPYSNESITHLATLERNMKRAIQDTPEISIDLEFTVLADAGYTKPKPGLGDTVPTVYEPIKDLDIDLRVMEIEEYPKSNKAPRVTLATVWKSLAKSNFSYQKSLLDKIFDENSGRLRYNVYDEAVKRATEALNNSLTELEYPVGMGIIARDPNDPNKFVAVRSSGIGLTTNGGLTFDEAITALGINTSLLTAGQIKTNNIQIIGNDDLFYWDGTALMAISATDANKFVKLNSDGLVINKGAITINGADGRQSVINGIINNNYSVFPHFPALTSVLVETNMSYLRTTATTAANLQLYTYRHEGRYLKVQVGHYVDIHEGITAGRVSLYTYNESLIAQHMFNNQGIASVDVNDQGYTTLTVDLGVPTYTTGQFYVKLHSGNSAVKVYCPVIRVWQEG